MSISVRCRAYGNTLRTRSIIITDIGGGALIAKIRWRLVLLVCILFAGLAGVAYWMIGRQGPIIAQLIVYSVFAMAGLQFASDMWQANQGTNASGDGLPTARSTKQQQAQRRRWVSGSLVGMLLLFPALIWLVRHGVGLRGEALMVATVLLGTSITVSIAIYGLYRERGR